MKEKIEKMCKSWFIYKDCEGILLDSDVVSRIDKNVTPILNGGYLSFYEFSSIPENVFKEIESGNLEVGTTYTGGYAGLEFSGECIDMVEMTNIENTQCFSYVWDEIDEGKSSEYERELCIKTDRYYQWDSQLSQISTQILEEFRYIHSEYEDEELSEELTKMKLKYKIEWEETISRYSNPMGYDCEVPTIDEIIEEIEIWN